MMKTEKKKTMKTRWTEEETKRLRELRKAGTKAGEIAEALGKSVRAVYMMAYKAGAKMKPCGAREITEDRQKARWMKAHYPHVSNAVCCSILGTSRYHLARAASIMGLTKTKTFRAEDARFNMNCLKRKNTKI